VDINLSGSSGKIVWQSEGLPFIASSLEIAPGNGVTGSTSHLHGRSVCLGEIAIGNSSMFLFAKGIGWTHGWLSGWSPDLGSIGIFPLRAAMWEHNVAQTSGKLGIPSSIPLAIVEKESLPGIGGRRLTASEVMDLDGSPAKPVVYYHATRFKQRICEWREIAVADRPVMLQKIMKRQDAVEHNDYIYFMTEAMARAAAVFHSLGGHNYAASSHNMTIGAELVDFEYAVLGLPHWDQALNGSPEAWQDKEIVGWLQTLAELLDVFESDLDRPALARHFIRCYLDLGGNDSLDMVRAILTDAPSQ
jgi:hypothetical protein